MEVFISWSGERSKKLAHATNTLIKMIFAPNVTTFMSDIDIESGTRGVEEIFKQLEVTDFGVLCLTQENWTKPWILFEAGAISKKTSNSRCCPVRLDFSSTAMEGPLSKFQSNGTTSEEMRKLVKSICTALKSEVTLDDEVIKERFSSAHQKFEIEISKIEKSPPEASVPKRTTDDLLKEILITVRSFDRRFYEEDSKRHFQAGAVTFLKQRYRLELIRAGDLLVQAREARSEGNEGKCLGIITGAHGIALEVIGSRNATTDDIEIANTILIACLGLFRPSGTLPISVEEKEEEEKEE